MNWDREIMQEKPATRRPSLASTIAMRVTSLAPGVYALLRGLARREVGIEPVAMFLRDPSSLYELLMWYYRDATTAMFIFRNLFVKPLAEYLGLYDKVDDLAKAARDGCDELLKLIRSLKPSVEPDEVGICAVGEEVVVVGGSGGRQVSYPLPSRLTTSLVEEFW